MKTIDEEIKASKFNSSSHKALINLFYTYNVLYSKHIEYFQQFDLQPQHYNVLRIIMGKHPQLVNPSHIISVMLDKKRDFTRLIDKLVKMEIVHRSMSQENKRMVLIGMTTKGIKLYERINKELDSIIFHGLSEKESEELSYLLDKMRAIE
jgi:DNA-binding MarR family transcriptional regulator